MVYRALACLSVRAVRQGVRGPPGDRSVAALGGRPWSSGEPHTVLQRGRRTTRVASGGEADQRDTRTPFGCAYWEVRLSEFRDSRRCPLATMIYPLVLVMSHLPPPATPLCFLEAHPAPDRYKNGAVIGSR
jgi:hypothetical protein